jgi:hypothetical protein
MKTASENLRYGCGVRNSMKFLALAALVVSQFVLSVSAQEKGAEINLVVGEVKTLPSPANRKIVRIGIGNGKLFNAKVLEKEAGLRRRSRKLPGRHAAGAPAVAGRRAALVSSRAQFGRGRRVRAPRRGRHAEPIRGMYGRTEAM